MPEPSREEIYQELAKEIDRTYQRFVATRALSGQALRNLLEAVFQLAAAVTEARNVIKMPFAKWTRIYCRSFDPRVSKSVCSVASRTHTGQMIETWQLRLLGVVAAVHHSNRPQALKRKHKTTSWISYLTKTKEEVRKMVERAGGVDKIPLAERAAILRQIGSLDDLKVEMRHNG